MDEDAGTAVFRVVLSHLYTSDVDVTATTSDGTATAGSDYTAVTTTVTIAAGTHTEIVSVPILDDSTYEGDETFTVTLSNPTGTATLGATPSAEATITDDELPTPQNVQLACVGDSDPFTLTATWEGTPTGPLAGADEKVWFLRLNSDDGRWTTNGGGSDFSPSGHTSTVTVSHEARYSVVVEWKIESGTDTQRTRAVATAACGNVLDLLTVTCVSTTGTDISLRINWDASLGVEDVKMSGTNGTPNPWVHTYDDLSEGSTVTEFVWNSHTFTFSDMRDTTHTQVHTLASNATTYEFSVPAQPAVAVASITIPGSSGDLSSVCPVPPVVSLSPAALTVAEDADPGVAVFTVSLSTATIHPVSVDVDTSDGTATAPADYTAIASQQVTIPPGDTTATVSVAIIDDSRTESDETFTVTISNPVNATLGTASATVTINDNDSTGGGIYH